MKLKTFKYLAFASLTAIILSSCGGGECAPSGVKTLDISMTAPSQYPAGKELDMPVIVTNTSSSLLQNVVYSIPNYITNTTVALNDAVESVLSITSQSQEKCATLAAGQSCQLMVHISSASVPGSFKVLAHNNNLNAEKNVVVGLVNVPATTGVGADGITLLYDQDIIGASATGNPPYVTELITMVVTSENVGQFNTFSIVDSNGNVIPYDVLTGNSGQGMTNLTPGSVVTLAVKVPSGSNQLIFKPVLKSDNNVIDNGTGKNPEVVNVTPPTIKKAILKVTPSIVNLNESTPSQTITLFNNGNIAASNLNISVADKRVTLSNNNCTSSLGVGSSCTYTVAFDANQPIVGTANSVINYNNNIANDSLNAVVNFRGKSPIVGLTVSSNNLGYNFNATTESHVVSSIVTLTNAGEVLPLTLDNWPTATNFSISTNAGTGDDCSNNQVLTPGDSCNILVTYDNANVSSGMVNMLFGFGYTDIDNSQKTGNTSIDLNYSTIQSVAVLNYDSYSYNLGTIVKNNVAKTQQNIVVTNNGQVEATSVNFSSLTQPFSIIANQCGATIARGASCILTVQFGPVASGSSAKETSLNKDSLNLSASSDGPQTFSSLIMTNYLPYTSATAVSSLSANLTGYVATAKTAILTSSLTSYSGFVAGNGTTQMSPFQVQQNAASPTVTYTLTNTGEVPESQFYLLTNSNALLPWTISANNCGTQQSPVTLAANGGSCNVTFNLATDTIGSNNLDLSSIQMTWVDQDSPNGQSQLIYGIIYANVFAAPRIVTTTYPASPIGTLIQNTKLTVTSTLQGGYNVSNQTITATISNDINSDMTASSATCQLSSSSASCDTIFTVKGSPVNESNVVVTIANSTTPAVVPTPSSYTFDVEYNTQPFYVAPASPKVGSGFDFSPTFTADQPSKNNPYTVTLPAGITTDSGASSYQMTSNPSTQHLNVAPGTPPGLYPINMTDSYGNTFVTYFPVAALKNMLYMASYSGIASCGFNPTDGSSTSTCTYDSIYGSYNSSAIVLNSTGTIAYGGGRFSRAGDIRICNVSYDNATSGRFTSCNNVNISGIAGDGVFGMAINQQQTKLYVGVLSSTNGNNLFVCDISPTNPTPINCTNQLSVNVKVGRINLNYNGNQLLFNNDSDSLYSCDILSNGNLGTCQSNSIVYSGGGTYYSAPGFSYNNKNLFTVGDHGLVGYTQYDQNTNQVVDNFANGLLNPITNGYSFLLTAIYLGPTYAFISAANSPSGMLACTLAANGQLNTCAPWTPAAGVSNVDNLFVFN